MVIAVSLDVRANVRFLLMVLNAGGDGVSWDVGVLRVGHGGWVWKMLLEKSG